jgi:hypothetical protein
MIIDGLDVTHSLLKRDIELTSRRWGRSAAQGHEHLERGSVLTIVPPVVLASPPSIGRCSREIRRTIVRASAQGTTPPQVPKQGWIQGCQLVRIEPEREYAAPQQIRVAVDRVRGGLCKTVCQVLQLIATEPGGSSRTAVQHRHNRRTRSCRERCPCRGESSDISPSFVRTMGVLWLSCRRTADTA